MLELLKIYSCTTVALQSYNYRIFDSQNLRIVVNKCRNKAFIDSRWLV